MASSVKKIAFASVSVALGAWAFKMVNEVSGPTMEPIVAACTDPKLTSDMQTFVRETGYHDFEPAVGLGAFNFLVCLITQFLLELRNTWPEGLLVWGGVVLVALTSSVATTVEAGRSDARGLIRYPMIIELLGQVVGISVAVPLLWIPAYAYGGGSGPVSTKRAYAAVPLVLPFLALTGIVFVADTESRLWTVSAGIMGGPLAVMAKAVLWPISDMNGDSCSSSTVRTCARAVSAAYRAASLVAFAGYALLLYIVHETYGADPKAVWDAVWTNANPSVAFMTVDTLVLYAAVLLFVAFRDVGSAVKAILLTPLVGPAAASYVLADLETKVAETSKEKRS